MTATRSPRPAHPSTAHQQVRGFLLLLLVTLAHDDGAARRPA